MLLSAGIISESFLAILPHYGDLLQIGFEDIQVASKKSLKVWRLVEDHPCVVGGADMVWHKSF